MRHIQLSVLFFVSLFFALSVPSASAQQAETKVFLNGVPMRVYFNDGDTFRVLEGPLMGTSARLAGFNTLETHGPVHGWGDWHPKELYFIAKMATLNSRQGVWHCTSDMSKDGYGRILADCPDLVVDQLKKGYAHAMAVGTSTPAEYLAAQREAQEARRGIWAKGIPEYILTSTHSASEPFEKGKLPYNRIASTADGRSTQWTHNEVYEECQKVVFQDVRLEPAKVSEAIDAMRKDPALAQITQAYTDDQLSTILTTFVRTGSPGTLQREGEAAAFTTFLTPYVAAGKLEPVTRSMPVYMIYTSFEHRYGPAQAPCLK